MNRLLSKGMSNIYLKVTIAIRSQNFDFLGLRGTRSPGQFWGTPSHADIIKS